MRRGEALVIERKKRITRSGLPTLLGNALRHTFGLAIIIIIIMKPRSCPEAPSRAIRKKSEAATSASVEAG
jgi:hypothetical protein